MHWIDPLGLERFNLQNPNGQDAISINTFNRVPDIPGTLMISAHGSSSQVADDRNGNRVTMDANGLAQLIQQSGVWEPGMPITMFACNAGEGENSIAEQLAVLLGTNVTAPNNYWIWNTLNYRDSGVFEGMFLIWPYGSGDMVTFTPEGPAGISHIWFAR